VEYLSTTLSRSPRVLFSSTARQILRAEITINRSLNKERNRDETDANINTAAWPRWESHISLEEFQLPPDLFTSMANHVLGKREELAGLHGEKTVFLYSVGSTEPFFNELTRTIVQIHLNG